MMKIIASIEIQGMNFSPKKVDSIIETHFSDRNEVGEFGQSGRFKNKPIPFGSATISFTESKDQSRDEILTLLRYVLPRIEIIRECGAEHIHLNLAYHYTGQCNEEFTVEELRLIALLGIPLIFSVYKV